MKDFGSSTNNNISSRALYKQKWLERKQTNEEEMERLRIEEIHRHQNEQFGRFMLDLFGDPIFGELNGFDDQGVRDFNFNNHENINNERMRRDVRRLEQEDFFPNRILEEVLTGQFQQQQQQQNDQNMEQDDPLNHPMGFFNQFDTFLNPPQQNLQTDHNNNLNQRNQRDGRRSHPGIVRRDINFNNEENEEEEEEDQNQNQDYYT